MRLGRKSVSDTGALPAWGRESQGCADEGPSSVGASGAGEGAVAGTSKEGPCSCQVRHCPGDSLGSGWGAGGCGPKGGGQGSGGGPEAGRHSHPQVGVLEFLCRLQATLGSCPHAPPCLVLGPR